MRYKHDNHQLVTSTKDEEEESETETDAMMVDGKKKNEKNS